MANNGQSVRANDQLGRIEWQFFFCVVCTAPSMTLKRLQRFNMWTVEVESSLSSHLSPHITPHPLIFLTFPVANLDCDAWTIGIIDTRNCTCTIWNTGNPLNAFYVCFPPPKAYHKYACRLLVICTLVTLFSIYGSVLQYSLFTPLNKSRLLLQMVIKLLIILLVSRSQPFNISPEI